MTSLRNNPQDTRSSEDLALDAARETILAVGWSRTTLTDIARRAGLSRMTLYRRWPEMNALLADLMTREWATLVDLDARPANHRARLVQGIVSTVGALRVNELFTRIIELDPEMLLPYLLDRPGRSQELVLGLLVGEPHLLARSLVLAAHGFTLSTQTMTDDELDGDAFDAELAVLVERYLAP
jgi:AcrR family transcriptional regulator